MEKKRVFSKSLLLLAITSIMLFAMSITSMAATNQTMNVHQTGGDDDTITLEWSSRLGYDHYDVEFSQDGVNWAYMEDTSSPKVTIYNNLSTGSTYYARVKAYKQGHILGDHDESTALVSESILVCTAPNKPTNLKQTKATKNSITMTWNAVPGATSYQIFIWEDWSYQLVGASNTNSVTIKGLSASSRRSYYVASVKNVNGYDAVGSKSDDLYAKTLPKKVTRMAINNLWANIRSCQYKYLTAVLMKIMEYHLQHRLILHLLDPLSICDLCSFKNRHISRKQKIQFLQLFLHTVKLCRSHQGIHRNNIYCVKFFCLHIFCNDLHRIFCRTVIKLYVQYVHFFIHLPHPFHFLGFCGQAIISNIQCFFNKRCKIFTFFKICNIIVNSQSHSSWIFLK